MCSRPIRLRSDAFSSVEGSRCWCLPAPEVCWHHHFSPPAPSSDCSLSRSIAPARRPATEVSVAALAIAALEARDFATEDDLLRAVQFVLAPRAARLPAPPDAAEPPPPPPPPELSDDAHRDESPEESQLADRVLAALSATLPPEMLRMTAAGVARRGRSAGKAGQADRGVHDRRIGSRSGDPRRFPIAILETVRAAVTFQRLRQAPAGRLIVRKSDLQVQRRVQPRGSTTLFVAHASGSAALNRLAEAKGAVELLLAGSYVRREQVALLVFRGKTVGLMLPPTRSLIRAKRALASLPGGGGTPLALALDRAAEVARQVRRTGADVAVVMLTDGRANVAREGTGGRPRAEAEAMASARAYGLEAHRAVLIDTSPRPNPVAGELAAAMGARWIPRPNARAETIHDAVAVAVG